MRKKFSILPALAVLAIAASAQSTEQPDSIERELQEIVVTAKQPATKLVGTALVSTIAGSNLQNIGTALDALAQLPMITVEEGAVAIIGKGKPKILIDGRPMRSDDELQLLQSSNIKKVELEMAPGAMYASDTRAVLKITTRRNFIDGLSLLERGEVAARRKWSANDMLDLNYRAGAWDFFASGLIAKNNSLIKGTTTNTLIFDGKPTAVGSSQRKDYPSTTGMAKAGFNYSVGDRSVGAYYRFNHERGHFSNLGDEWIDDEPRIPRNIYTGARGGSHLVSVYYDNTFAAKYHIHFDGDYKNSQSASDALTVYPRGNAKDVASSSSRHSTLWAGKLYLTFPMAKGQFTAGTQDSYTRATLDYLMLTPEVGEYIPSSSSEATQTSAAAFASWSGLLGKFSLSAGLRYEYANYLFLANGKKRNSASRIDHFLTPDISLGYCFNDESQLSLSYKMSTVKPPYSQLTGSLTYVGLHEIEGGNAALKDERMHDLQLFGMWKDFILQADFTRSIDTYAFVKKIYPAPTLQLLMQPVNANVSAIDLYLVWSRRIKAWTPNATIGMHKQWLAIDGSRYNRPIFSYYISNAFSLPKGFIATIDANGQSRGDMHTNQFHTTRLAIDASISKSFFNNSLQLRLSATDIFNSQNNDWSMQTYGIRVDKAQSYDRRGLEFSLTYRFQPRKSKYKGQAAAESELNRL